MLSTGKRLRKQVNYKELTDAQAFKQMDLLLESSQDSKGGGQPLEDSSSAVKRPRHQKTPKADGNEQHERSDSVKPHAEVKDLMEGACLESA